MAFWWQFCFLYSSKLVSIPQNHKVLEMSQGRLEQFELPCYMGVVPQVPDRQTDRQSVREGGKKGGNPLVWQLVLMADRIGRRRSCSRSRPVMSGLGMLLIQSWLLSSLQFHLSHVYVPEVIKIPCIFQAKYSPFSTNISPTTCGSEHSLGWAFSLLVFRC